MPVQIRHTGVDVFDQDQIDTIGKAIDRAWSIIKNTDDIHPEEDAKKALAQCVLAETRTGEGEHLVLVNRSIMRFRAQRARLISELRRRSV